LAEREGTVEEDRGSGMIVRFDDMTAEFRIRQEVTILDIDLYRARLTSLQAPPALPAWGKHQRMGHTTVYGYVEPYGHGTVRLTAPAIDGDAERLPLAEEVHIVPMSGPGFFGFEVLTEDAVRTARATEREYRPEPPAPKPAPAIGYRVAFTSLLRNGGYVGGNGVVTALGDGGTVTIVCGPEPYRPSPDDRAYELTATEWANCIDTILDADGNELFSDCPF
jgi:hypothetical protein